MLSGVNGRRRGGGVCLPVFTPPARNMYAGRLRPDFWRQSASPRRRARRPPWLVDTAARGWRRAASGAPLVSHGEGPAGPAGQAGPVCQPLVLALLSAASVLPERPTTALS